MKAVIMIALVRSEGGTTHAMRRNAIIMRWKLKKINDDCSRPSSQLADDAIFEELLVLSSSCSFLLDEETDGSNGSANADFCVCVVVSIMMFFYEKERYKEWASL